MNYIKLIPLLGLACISSCMRVSEKEYQTPSSKKVIYQVLPRLFGNDSTNNIYNGTIQQNGIGKFADFTSPVLDSLHSLGINCIWYTGIISHATKTGYPCYNLPANHPGIVKGNAGSPYAIRDYYDVDPDLATNVAERMAEFEALVDRTHASGMDVLIDFIPNHVAREYKSSYTPKGSIALGAGDDTTKPFSTNNNFYYLPGQSFNPDFDVLGYTEIPAKATGNDVFSASPSVDDWYETVKLNYGIDYTDGKAKHFDTIPATWKQMRDILLFWKSKKVDGFRVDMAEMVPVEFWEWTIPQVKERYPETVFIAEIYNPDSYRDYIHKGRFDYLYDKVGLYDTLKYVIQGKSPATSILANAEKIKDIQSHMLNFLENHDEQRIASSEFAGNPQAGIPMMIVSSTYSGNPFMIYFGQELGEKAPDAEGFGGADGRTTIFDYWSIPSIQAWRNGGKNDGGQMSASQKELRDFYKKLLNLVNDEPVLSNGIRYELMKENLNNTLFNHNRQFTYIRQYRNEIILAAVNFDSIPAKTDIIITPETFRELGIPSDLRIKGKDLLTGKEEESILSSTQPFHTEIAPFSGKLIKFRFQPY